MGTTTSKNLGLIAAIKTGVTPPANKNLIWMDTNTIPPTKKSFDVGTQNWLEIVFLPSPANVIKKMIIVSAEDDNIDTYSILNEDIFIKRNNGATFINLPLPGAEYNGKLFEIVNQHDVDLVYFNFPIKINNNFELEELSAKTSMRIVCSLFGNSFKWIMLSKSNLL